MRRRRGSTEAKACAVVREHPGLTTNQVVLLVGERRQVTLAVLGVLKARGYLRAEPGPRRSLHWFPVDESGTAEEVSE